MTDVRPLFEVLLRRPDGHETVHRINADDKAGARALVVSDLGATADARA